MADLALLILVWLIVRKLAKTTIDKKLYYTLYFTVLFVVAASTIVILNSETIASFTNNLFQPLVEIGLGNPKSWFLRTRSFDAQIMGCYYICFFGVWLIFLISTAHESSDVAFYEGKDMIFKVTALLIGLLFVIGWGFYFEMHYVGGRASHSIRTVFDSKIGIVLFEVMFLYFAKCFAPVARKIFAEN